MSEIEREIKSYLKNNLKIEIREETDKMQTYKTVFVELFLDDERIDWDSISFPIE